MLDRLPINWGIIRNPLNWLTVILMLTIVSFLADALLRRIDTNNS